MPLHWTTRLVLQNNYFCKNAHLAFTWLHLHIESNSVLSHHLVMIKVILFGANITMNRNTKGGKEIELDLN